MRRAGIAVPCAVGLFACNVITGLSDDFKVASSELDAGDDGPIGSGDDSGPDHDGTMPDVAPPKPDAGAFCNDAGLGTEGSGVVFCTDFESVDASDPNLGWSKHDTSTNCSVTLHEDGGVLGTRALRAYAGDAGGSRKAALVKSFPALPGAFYELTFSFRVKAIDFTYSVVGLVGFNVDLTNNYYGLAEHNKNAFDVSSPPGTPDGTYLAADNAWHTAKIRLSGVNDAGGGSYNGTIFVDGTFVDAFNGLPSGNQPAEIRVGAFFTATAVGVAEVYVDNVILVQR